MEAFYHSIGDFNIEIKPVDGKPLLSKEEAVEIAKKDAGERISNEAKKHYGYVCKTYRSSGRGEQSRPCFPRN